MPFPSLDRYERHFALDTFLKYPAFVAPTGSVQGAGNTVTLGTTLTNTYSDGVWLYLPTMTSGGTGLTAGWWFVVMSSATLGSIKGTVQTYPNNNPDTTQFDVLGDSNFTGETAEITAFLMPLPLSLLGSSGKLICEVAKAKSAGTTAVVRSRIGNSATPASNSSMLSSSLTSSGLSQNDRGVLYATAYNRQFTIAQNTNGFANGTGAPQLLTIDTSAAWYFAVTINTVGATQACGIMSISLSVEL